MDNEISKAIKRKTDAQMRMNATDLTPVVNEGVGSTTIINDPSKYIIPMVAGKNVTIGTSGSNKVINALMNILAGDNITVTEPDENGAVTISANIGGKSIDLTGLADGYVLTYDVASDSFILAELPDTLSQATETELGGVKAKARTTENAEVAIDETTGKLYAPESGGSYTLPQASEATLGGVKAKEKTTETSEVAIDPATGRLYCSAPTEAENGLPTGGTAGQIPAKIDGMDFNVQWIDPPTGSTTETKVYPVLLNPWQQFDASLGSAVYFWKDALGFVHLHGIIKAGAQNSVAFAFPVGCRPGPGDTAYTMARTTGLPHAIAGGYVLDNGNFTPIQNTYSGGIVLTGISFKAEG